MCNVYEGEVVSMTRARKGVELGIVVRKLHETILGYSRKDDHNMSNLLIDVRSLLRFMCRKDAAYEASY